MLTIRRSYLTSEKLGASTLGMSITKTPEASPEAQSMISSDLIQDFDAICRSSHHIGLKCCMKAAQNLAQRYHDIQGMFVFPAMESWSAHDGNPPSVRVHLNQAPGNAQVVIDLPKRAVKSSVLGMNDLGLLIENVSLYCELWPDDHQETHDANGTQRTVFEEITIIAQAFDSICENALGNTEYSSFEEIPPKLADVVLEVLNLPSLNIALQKVELSIRQVSNLHASFRGKALRSSRTRSTADKLQAHAGVPLGNLPKTEVTKELDSRGGHRESLLPIVDPAHSNEVVEIKSVASPTSHPASPEISESCESINMALKQGDNETPSNDLWHHACIALGSNVGDRLKNIEAACHEMDADPDIRVVETSPLYETDPMYVVDQGKFLNGACKVRERPLSIDRLGTC